jgi:beta-galactosidase
MLSLLLAGIAVAQDGIFHEVPSATSTITYDGRKFIIKGKPTFITCAEMHQPRIPKELLRDRMTRVKRAGYNTVATYAFWDMIEPVRGEFHLDSTGQDLDAWLKLCEDFGFYTMVRAGPYICGEWDNGGYPPWLADVPNMVYRRSTGPFMGCADAYWKKLFPVIVRHQITRGGSVIMVQLENEYRDITDNTYRQHLIDSAHAFGLEVPYIWSEINHGNNPDPPPFSTGTAPWFSSEFWMGWIGVYGEYPSTNAEPATWRIVAAGTGGYSHYMAHGGTNFGYTTSHDQRITSYDYGAPIGELGQFRSYFWPIKQANMLTRSFEEILCTSTNGGSQVTLSPSSGLQSYVNTTGKGTIAFVFNTTSSPISFKLKWNNKNISVPTASSWTIAGGKRAHFFSDVPLTDNVSVDYSAAGILTLNRFGTNNYLVLYGDIGVKGDIALKFITAPAGTPPLPWQWDATAKRAALQLTFPPDDSVIEYVIDAGSGQTMNLLVMNTAEANRTWVDSQCIACGPEFVDENGKLQFSEKGGRAYVFSAKGGAIVSKPASAALAAISLSSGWKWMASPEIDTSYDISSWKSHSGRQDFGSYGWANGYGWYRCIYTASQATSATMSANGVTDRCFFFVNGKPSGGTAQFKQGKNYICVLAAGYGKSKEYHYYSSPTDQGSEGGGDRAGLLLGLTVGGQNFPGTGNDLFFRGGFDGLDESPFLAEIPYGGWNGFLNRQWNASVAPVDGIPRIWRIDFNYTPPANAFQTWTLKGDVAQSGRGVVWINGHCLGRNLENQPPLFVPHCWLKSANTIIVFTEDGKAPQNYSLQPVEYRSIVDNSVVKSRQPASNAGTISSCNTTERLFLMMGNRFVLPHEFAGKYKHVAIYTSSGKLVQASVIRDTIVLLKQSHGALNGGYIVRVRAIRH